MTPLTPLVIATHNEGKAREIRALLAPLGIEVLSAASLGLPEPEETGTTFRENAGIKSLSAAEHSGHWALADDSGLSVEALDGAPGVYSADWAGPGKHFPAAFERIKRELIARNCDPHHASAFFSCFLSLRSPQGEEYCFEGRVEGKLAFPPRGGNGFGYDPLFIPDGHDKTCAEMELNEKLTVSARARALELFILHFKQTRKAAS